jgi:NAD(P)-dependent dehydrogenase (short-subunit alcohol dehydrogenase family)
MTRCVLITGASRGIGRAVATAFAEGGDRVAVHYSTRRTAAEATLTGLAGQGHMLVHGDISDPAQAERVVEETVVTLGKVDVLVNNAAVMTAHPVQTTSYPQWQAAWNSTMNVNLFGAANMSYCVASHLIARSAPGAIVNVGSRGAFRGEPDHPAYAASKAALHALGQSLAVSLAPQRISVASVAPGFVATERVSGRLEGAKGDRIAEQSPFGRVAAPDEIAAAVHYLASPAATWSSGAILDVNGASYLRT